MDYSMTGPDGRTHPVTKQALRLTYDDGIDVLTAIPDAHLPLAMDQGAEALYAGPVRFLVAPEGIVGFQIALVSLFDADEVGLPDLMYGPTFALEGTDGALTVADVAERVGDDPEALPPTIP